jgi:hypothetical protein
MGERFSFSAGKEAIISYTILLVMVFSCRKKPAERDLEFQRERKRAVLVFA